MAVDSKLHVSKSELENLREEWRQALAMLPPVLRSRQPEACIDHLIKVFDEEDRLPLSTAYAGLRKAEGDGCLLGLPLSNNAHSAQLPSTSTEQMLAARQLAGHMSDEILLTEATSVTTSIELGWLGHVTDLSTSLSSNDTDLVSCSLCQRSVLKWRIEAHKLACSPLASPKQQLPPVSKKCASGVDSKGLKPPKGKGNKAKAAAQSADAAAPPYNPTKLSKVTFPLLLDNSLLDSFLAGTGDQFGFPLEVRRARSALPSRSKRTRLTFCHMDDPSRQQQRSGDTAHQARKRQCLASADGLNGLPPSTQLPSQPSHDRQPAGNSAAAPTHASSHAVSVHAQHRQLPPRDMSVAPHNAISSHSLQRTHIHKPPPQPFAKGHQVSYSQPHPSHASKTMHSDGMDEPLANGHGAQNLLSHPHQEGNSRAPPQQHQQQRHHSEANGMRTGSKRAWEPPPHSNCGVDRPSMVRSKSEPWAGPDALASHAQAQQHLPHQGRSQSRSQDGGYHNMHMGREPAQLPYMQLHGSPSLGRSQSHSAASQLHDYNQAYTHAKQQQQSPQQLQQQQQPVPTNGKYGLQVPVLPPAMYSSQPQHPQHMTPHVQRAHYSNGSTDGIPKSARPSHMAQGDPARSGPPPPATDNIHGMQQEYPPRCNNHNHNSQYNHNPTMQHPHHLQQQHLHGAYNGGQHAASQHHYPSGTGASWAKYPEPAEDHYSGVQDVPSTSFGHLPYPRLAGKGSHRASLEGLGQPKKMVSLNQLAASGGH